MKEDGTRMKCPECGCKVFKIFVKDGETQVKCRNCTHIVIKLGAKTNVETVPKVSQTTSNTD